MYKGVGVRFVDFIFFLKYTMKIWSPRQNIGYLKPWGGEGGLSEPPLDSATVKYPNLVCWPIIVYLPQGLVQKFVPSHYRRQPKTVFSFSHSNNRKILLDFKSKTFFHSVFLLQHRSN